MKAAVSIRLENLTIGFGEDLVLRNVSLDIPSSQWTALLGPNGAGKSSMLRAIVGNSAGRCEGRVLFPANAGPPAKFLAFVPQNPTLPAGMTVGEYVLLGRTAHLGWLRREGHQDRQIAQSAIRRLELDRFADRDLTELSGGEAQRAVLARALCQGAEILILDEPTTSLDVGHQMDVMELVEDLILTEGLTAISAIHDLTAAARFCTNFVLLGNGQVVASGGMESVLDPGLLSQHFGTPMHRMQGPDGLPVIVPLNRKETNARE